ncbi:hypothetical protein HMPREF3219_0201452, partial [Streptococcus salivarius]
DVVGSSPTGGVIRHLKFNDLSFFIYLKNKQVWNDRSIPVLG